MSSIHTFVKRGGGSGPLSPPCTRHCARMCMCVCSCTHLHVRVCMRVFCVCVRVWACSFVLCVVYSRYLLQYIGTPCISKLGSVRCKDPNPDDDLTLPLQLPIDGTTIFATVKMVITVDTKECFFFKIPKEYGIC